jgi:hypothetical protein
MADLPKDILEHLDSYEPPVDERLIGKFIRDQLSDTERKEVAVIVDGCKTWTRAYDRMLKTIRATRSPLSALPEA